MNNLKTIGIFGGTFDPIHIGHLRAALEIRENLGLAEMRIIPGKHPPHRPPPAGNPRQRLEMVRMALVGSPLIVDEREMTREGPSYSVDTLMSLRREYPLASLSMTVRMDVFLELHSWHQWEKIIQLANIIVTYPRGWKIPEQGIMSNFYKTYKLASEEKLSSFSAGKILLQPITALDIAARNIRAIIKAGHSPQFLVTEKVLEYIQKEKLYGYNESMI